jgi:hypothetical protein
MATCAQCGATVDEPDGIPAEERKQCPNCGSTGRLHEGSATAVSRVSVSAEASVERGLNDVRLAVFGVIIAVPFSAAALAAPAGWPIALVVGVGSAVLTVVAFRWRPARHLLMEAMHRITGQ